MIKTYKNKYNNKYCYAAQYTGTPESIEDIKSFYNNFINHYKIEDVTVFGNPKNLLEVKLSYIKNNEKEYICQYFMTDNYIVCNASGKIDGYSTCNKKTFEEYYYEIGRYRAIKNNKLYEAIQYNGDNGEDILLFLKSHKSNRIKIEAIDEDCYGLVVEFTDIETNNKSTVNIEKYSFIVFIDESNGYTMIYKETDFWNKFTLDIDNKEQETTTTINTSISNTISILGTEYTLFRCKEGDGGVDSLALGVCDRNLKQIRIVDTSTIDRYKKATSEWKYQQELYTLYHEIVHAYLTESGLNSNTHYATCWSEDEEVVDWIALQTEKIAKSFKEADEWLKQFFTDKEEE